MIKGVSKEVMVVSNCKDPMFEQIIFIVKPEVSRSRVSEARLRIEADKIIEKATLLDQVRPKKSKRKLSTPFYTLIVGGSVALLCLFFELILTLLK